MNTIKLLKPIFQVFLVFIEIKNKNRNRVVFEVLVTMIPVNKEYPTDSSLILP